MNNASQYLIRESMKSHRELVCVTIIQIILCISSIIANGLNLICFMKFKYLQKIENIFICSLSVADLGTAVCELAAACWAYREWPNGKCNITVDTCLSYINYTMICLSIVSIAAVTVERFSAIVYPLKYAMYFTKAKLILGEGVLCTFTILMVGVLAIAFDGHILNPCFGNQTGHHIFVTLTVGYIFGAILLFIMYSTIFYYANLQKAKINSVVPLAENSTKKTKVINFKALRFVIVVLVTLLFLYSPFGFILVVHMYKPEWVPLVMIISVQFIILNGIGNVIIYAIFNQKIRKAYTDLFGGEQCT